MPPSAKPAPEEGHPPTGEPPSDTLRETVRRAILSERLSWEKWSRCRVAQSAAWRWVLTDVPFAVFNHALRLSPEAFLSRRDIEEGLAPLAGSGLPAFVWLPAAAAAAIDEGGFSERLVSAFSTPAMAMQMAEGRLDAPLPPDTLIGEVRDDRDLALWSSLIADTLAFPPTASRAWLELHRALHKSEGRRRRHFTAVAGGRIVGTASIFLSGDTALLQAVVVAKGYRRRGIGSALSRAALAKAREQGSSLAVLTASVDGAGIYRCLGFREYERFECFQFLS